MSKPVGPAINVRLGPKLQAAVDTWATVEDLSRAEAIRSLLSIAIFHELVELQRRKGDMT